jgi:hypothetical protein
MFTFEIMANYVDSLAIAHQDDKSLGKESFLMEFFYAQIISVYHLDAVFCCECDLMPLWSSCKRHLEFSQSVLQRPKKDQEVSF